MKEFDYQNRAVRNLTEKLIYQIKENPGRRCIIFEAPTGSGKTVMTCRTLAGLSEAMRDRGYDNACDCAFIWIAPRDLHIQSYNKLKNIFSDTNRLATRTFGDIDPSEGIRPGEILFVNWESVNRKKNVIVRDRENCVGLYEIVRRTREAGLPVVVIIDEEQMFWTGTADKSAQVLERIDADVELRVSATPKTRLFDDIEKVQRGEVIRAGMIKKEIVLNPDVDVTDSKDITLDERLLKAALERRDRLAEAYAAQGENINPLLLIQLPNDTSDGMTAEDTAVAAKVTGILRRRYDISEENGRLAVWLASRKVNLDRLEDDDNMVKVLLFKEAIALGWDCPRAGVLLIFRKLQSEAFTVQTVGRIMRMPRQRHYRDNSLNLGYVYTDIAKDRIKIVTEDQSYILRDTIAATRRDGVGDFSLPSVYYDRPAGSRNRLRSGFRKDLFDTVADKWHLSYDIDAPVAGDLGDFADIPGLAEALAQSSVTTVEHNRRIARRDVRLRLDADTIEAAIPMNVRFQNDVQELEVEQVRFARTDAEIDTVFRRFVNGFGTSYESNGGNRTDMIATYLLETVERFLGVAGTAAKKLILSEGNRDKFAFILDSALERYGDTLESVKTSSARKVAPIEWSLPSERFYDDRTNEAVAGFARHALQPFVRLISNASTPERAFEEYLENHSDGIDWWYKNGDSGMQHLAVPYTKLTGEKSLFYPDFIIRMKDGRIFIFDTKTAESEPATAYLKHNALRDYIAALNADGRDVDGGVIIRPDGQSYWIYPRHDIATTAAPHSSWTQFSL